MKRTFWKARKVVGGPVGLLVLLAAGLPTPANAYQRPGHTERASLASDASQADGHSRSPSLSGDGHNVAFVSAASNLVAGDTNGVVDIFIKEIDSGEIERVSVASDGTQSRTFGSFNPTISADGRYVAFESHAPNLVPGDTNGSADIFVHDRSTRVTERASLAADGRQCTGTPNHSSISDDGRYVAFSSASPCLVPGDTNGVADVFVKDRLTGAIERASVASDGTQASAGNAGSHAPSMSADGRYVTFLSYAENLVPGDTNGDGGGGDVFVRDLHSGVTERVSVASDGTEANDGSSPGVISADGRYVAFDSLASNLVPSDINKNWDVFVHDRETRETQRVSLPSSGAEEVSTDLLESGSSLNPSITADGRYVAFASFHDALVDDDTNRNYDVFVHDRKLGSTERVSLTSEGSQSIGDSVAYPAVAVGEHYISDDGSRVAFWSAAPNLVPDDSNGLRDVFVRDRGPSTGIGDLTVVADDDRLSPSGWATFSGEVLASATDVVGDGTLQGNDAGTDLSGATLTYRNELEDLLARLRVPNLPDATGTRPGVMYGFTFDVGGTRYEVRALRVSGTAVPVATPYFGLYRCEATCLEQTKLSGGLGTAGDDVTVSIPLAGMGAEGEIVSEIAAFTAVGEATTGGIVQLDRVDLPDATIPAPEVLLGIASAGTPEKEVTFSDTSTVADGAFSGTLQVGYLPGGDYDVWARACLSTSCGATSMPVTISGDPTGELKATALELTVVGRGAEMALQARLIDAITLAPIAGRTISFYSDSESIGSQPTDDAGIAILPLPPDHRGNNRTYEAIFEGDEFYLGASDEKAGKGKGGNGGGNGGGGNGGRETSTNYGGKVLLM